MQTICLQHCIAIRLSLSVGIALLLLFPIFHIIFMCVPSALFFVFTEVFVLLRNRSKTTLYYFHHDDAKFELVNGIFRQKKREYWGICLCSAHTVNNRIERNKFVIHFSPNVAAEQWPVRSKPIIYFLLKIFFIIIRNSKITNTFINR